VALLFRVKNIEEAIALANDSPFGLGSSAWTNNPAEIERLITEIELVVCLLTVWLNRFSLTLWGI
jgi:acyl-CoA reductase-like NAD-dependent aldehyde dehydrogenase